MTIHGISQSTGSERLIEVGAAEAGLQLSLRDRKPGSESGLIVVPIDALMSVLTEQPAGPQSIGSEAGPGLVVEVRRNEVLLALGGLDAAVGLDDLLDAVGSVLPVGGGA